MRKILITLSILTVLFFSCKEENVINPSESTSLQACYDHLTAENIFNDIGIIVEKGFMDNWQKKTCPNYILMNTDTADIDTLIIDFGSGECPPTNGKIRSGKIEITYTGKYRDALSVITTTFNDYHVNYHLVQGKRIVTNEGINSDGNMWYTIEINDASINTDNGIINWESNRVREWIKGQNTNLDISDDGYKIIGTASGNAGNGNNFTAEIIDSLEVDLECLLYAECIVKSGSVKISPSGGYSDRIINYGDSLCDCNADVVINENNYPIVISN